jgi:hypothetical protein
MGHHWNHALHTSATIPVRARKCLGVAGIFFKTQCQEKLIFKGTQYGILSQAIEVDSTFVWCHTQSIFKMTCRCGVSLRNNDMQPWQVQTEEADIFKQGRQSFASMW